MLPEKQCLINTSVVINQNWLTGREALRRFVIKIMKTTAANVNFEQNICLANPVSKNIEERTLKTEYS